MLMVKTYNFPTPDEGRFAVEQKRNELARMYRSGHRLDAEEMDWLDWADNVLTALQPD